MPISTYATGPRFRTVVGNGVKIKRPIYTGQLATDADSGVNVTVTREDGTVLVTSTAATHETTGVYSYTLAPAHTSRLDVLTITWTGAIGGVTFLITDLIDVAGGRYFDLNELAAIRGVSASDDVLEVARLKVEDAIERVTGISWIRRYAHERYDGAYAFYDPLLQQFGLQHVNRLPSRSLIAVNYSGIAQDITKWTLSETGRIDTAATSVFPFVPGGQNVDIFYGYGYDAPPNDLRGAALAWARHLIKQPDSNTPDRANMMHTDWATFSLATANVDYPSGLPEVDAVVNNYEHDVPGFA